MWTRGPESHAIGGSDFFSDLLFDSLLSFGAAAIFYAGKGIASGIASAWRSGVMSTPFAPGSTQVGSVTLDMLTLGLKDVPKLLQSAPQLSARWGMNSYKHGGKMYAIEHIMYRHAANSGWAAVSRFGAEFGAREVKNLVTDALRYGIVQANGRNGFEVIYNAGRVIGTDFSGKATSYMAIYVRNGAIQTAFPF